MRNVLNKRKSIETLLSKIEILLLRNPQYRIRNYPIYRQVRINLLMLLGDQHATLQKLIINNYILVLRVGSNQERTVELNDLDYLGILSFSVGKVLSWVQRRSSSVLMKTGRTILISVGLTLSRYLYSPWAALITCRGVGGQWQ